MKRTYRHRITLLTLLVFGMCNAQIHLNGGVTDISNRIDGNTLSWSIGYTHVLGKVGVKGSYRKTSVLGLNYTALDFLGVLRHQEKNYRLTFGLGPSYNDVNYKIDLAGSITNSFRITHNAFIIADLVHVRRENNITHFLIGFELDI
ncbi:MAG: hypothetical protein AAGF96_06075 [Bacteroidota bacterium]